MKIESVVSEVINNYINNIINESKNLLTERVSSIVYHWCSFRSVIKILNNNRFSLMNNLFKHAETDFTGTSHNRMWYMSLTRNPNIKQGGYNNSGSYYVRLTLDGDRINSNFHTKAIDYFQGKNYRYTHPNYNTNTIDKPNYETESEDRIYSRKPFIENAYSYIKAIDIFFGKGQHIDEILAISSKANRITHIYLTIDDFNSRSNPLDGDEFREWLIETEQIEPDYYGSSIRDLDSSADGLPTNFLASIVYIVNFLHGDFNDCIRTLREYGLEKYAKRVANYIKNHNSFRGRFYFKDKSSFKLKGIRELIGEHFSNIELANDAQLMNREDLAKAYSILSDFCKKNKLKNEDDFVKYFAKMLGKDEIKQDAYKKIYNITCVNIPNESGTYLCVDPTQTKYADVFGKDTLRWMFDDLTYYVDSHKSKDDEKFKGYLRYRLLKENPTIQDIITLYDNLKSLGNERLDLDYKPILSTKQVKYWDITYCLNNQNSDWNSFRTTDETYVRITDKNQYNQLKKILNNNGK